MAGSAKGGMMPGYARMPDGIPDKIAKCSSDEFFVGTLKTYEVADLAAGALTHLDVSVIGGEVVVPGGTAPPPARGRWSRWNVLGRRIIRKDLPKVSKSWGWDVPIYGDYKKGTVHITHTRDVWQWQDIHGANLPILMEAQEPVAGHVTIAFRVDRVFDRRNYAERDLLMALSLLRENVGRPDIVAANLTVEAWLADQTVDWEILPVGTRELDDVIEDLVKRLRLPPDSPRQMTLRERMGAIAALHPPAAVIGDGEFTRYFGFKFREDLIVLENVNYGNALYVMYEDWQDLSKRSRIELLAEPDANYDRIVHRDGWERRLRALLMLRGHDPSDPE